MGGAMTPQALYNKQEIQPSQLLEKIDGTVR
jgi:hypothetical protein